jgi:hypothetical protein
MSPLTQCLADLARQRQLRRSIASVVRAELSAIQAARRAGLSYAEICKGLHSLGIEVSARTLRHTVYRIQGQQGATAPAAALDAQIGVTLDLFAP